MKYIKKTIVIVIIGLFLGAGCIPSIAELNTSDEDVNRYAIAMGFSFDGIMWDAYCLRDILTNHTPDIWPMDHIKIYSHDSWDNIIDGLRWIESQEDENDITIWQSAGHGNPYGLASETDYITYAELDREFDKFEGSLLIMICACGSCYAHSKLAGDNRIIITGRTPLNDMPCQCQDTTNNHPLLESVWTYFIMHFIHPLYGAWGNQACDLNYGNNDGWISAEEAFSYVEDSFDWPDEIWNEWCYAHLYMTDGVEGNLDITFIGQNTPPEDPIIQGPNEGEAGTRYTYEATAIDPNGDQIYYLFDWGDDTNSDWIGPFNSGETGSASNIWGRGTYTIRVKTKDTYNFESNWTTMEVTMPKNKTIDYPFLDALKNHPMLYHFLQQLLRIP